MKPWSFTLGVSWGRDARSTFSWAESWSSRPRVVCDGHSPTLQQMGCMEHHSMIVVPRRCAELSSLTFLFHLGLGVVSGGPRRAATGRGPRGL